MKDSFLEKNRKTNSGKFLSRGFTIVELMVVSSIIIIMSAYVAANYHQGNKDLALEMAAGELAQNLRRVQEWGYSAHQIGGISYTGYGIALVAGDTEYLIYTDDNGDGYYASSDDTVRQTIVLNDDFRISSIKPCGPSDSCTGISSLSVNYIPPDPGTRIIYSSNEYDQATIVLDVGDTSTTRSVVVNRAGLIYVK